MPDATTIDVSAAATHITWHETYGASISHALLAAPALGTQHSPVTAHDTAQLDAIRTQLAGLLAPRIYQGPNGTITAQPHLHWLHVTTAPGPQTWPDGADAPIMPTAILLRATVLYPSALGTDVDEVMVDLTEPAWSAAATWAQGLHAQAHAAFGL